MNKPPSQGNPPEPAASEELSPRPRSCHSRGGMAHRYFAYGSNLRSAQMARLCPGHVFLGPARLAGYRLAFRLPDTGWQGGVADLIESYGDEVWGALYRLTDADLPPLDDYEGFDPRGPSESDDYLRREVTVTVEGERRASKAWCYFVRAPQGHVAPSDLYRTALIEGAIERGLPAAYIETMRRAFAGPDR